MCEFTAARAIAVNTARSATENAGKTSTLRSRPAGNGAQRSTILPKFRRSGAFLPLILLVVIVGSLIPTAMSVDEVVTWQRFHPQGGKPYDQLQCQTVTVQWGGDGLAHSLYEFTDEIAYKNCDFSNAWLLVGPQTAGTFVISREDNLTPGKKWFGSDVGDDCTNARMKFSVKTRPLLDDKIPGYECDGDFSPEDVVVKNAVDIKECRKICKRRRGCVAIQYIGGGKQKCRLFEKAPFRAVQVSSNIHEGAACLQIPAV